MWRRVLGALGATVVGVGLLWVLFGPLPAVLGGADLESLAPAERLAATSTIRGQVGTVLSAAFVGAGLYYTGKRFLLERDKQFTDRFNAAVDHLGSADDIVRAGGVRALDRILHDSPTDRNRVVETLTEFIRRHSGEPTGMEPIRTDVAAAVAALRARREPGRNVVEGPLDLHGVRLPAASLRGAALPGATLTAADLSDATLAEADLTGAGLRTARLAGADLTAARLDGADLTEADLRATTLTRTELGGAVLVNTDLRGTDLRETAGLTTAQIKRARVDEHTRLPPTVDNPLDGPPAP